MISVVPSNRPESECATAPKQEKVGIPVREEQKKCSYLSFPHPIILSTNNLVSRLPKGFATVPDSVFFGRWQKAP